MSFHIYKLAQPVILYQLFASEQSQSNNPNHMTTSNI